jgi:hypothetical protein
MPDTSFLYTTVKNLMGVDHVFGYLPPHGKKLLANQTFTVPGDLANRILTTRVTPMQRSFKSLERDLLAGRLAIESTPRPIFFDASPPAQVTNPSAAITAGTAGSTTWTGTTGAYTIWITWANAYGETTVGASQLAAPVTLTNGVSKLQVTVPAFPSGATIVNVYMSTPGSALLSTATFLFTSNSAGATLNGPANFPAATNPPGANTAKIAAPALQPAVNVTGGGATGGLLASGAYFLKYTWTTPLGETTGSPESQNFTVATGNIPTVQVAPAPPGATGLNVYLTAAAGSTNTEVLYASYPVPVNSGPPSVLAGYLQPSTATNQETPNSLILLAVAAPSSAVTVPGANTALLPVPTLTPVVIVTQNGVPNSSPPLSVITPYLAPGQQGDVFNGAPQVNGLLQAGSYFLKYTYTGPSGETTVSPESTQFTVSAGQIPVVLLTDPDRDPSGIGLFPAGVTGVNIYLTVAAGATGTETLYASGITAKRARLTIPTGGVVPPLSNTTAGHSIRSIRVNNDTVGTVDPSWGSYEGPQ